MKTAMPSDRSFGWTFAGVFALGGVFYPWALALAAATALVTLLRAQWLAPLKLGWMKLGELLHHVASPIVLGFIFFAVFAPIGFAMRLAGRDAMKRRFEAALPTYWVGREPPGPADDSFRDMF